MSEQWTADVERVIELINEVSQATGFTTEHDLIDPVANAVRSEAELWQRINRRGPYAAVVAAFVQREREADPTRHAPQKTG